MHLPIFLHMCFAPLQLFPEVLKASRYVTKNPEEADYFYADGGSGMDKARFQGLGYVAQGRV